MSDFNHIDPKDSESNDSKDFIPPGWLKVYETSDLWEAKLLKTAILADGIRCQIKAKKKAQFELLVPEEKQEEAQILIREAVIAISDYHHSQDFQSEADESQASRSATKTSQSRNAQGAQEETTQAKIRIPHSSPTAARQTVIAHREGIGEIVHFDGRGYELRVGPTPHYMVAESRWEEFTDFSAQRQEFAILLKGEYPQLFKWLKTEKQMAEFIKLVESTYREVPPPKPKKLKTKTTSTPQAQNQAQNQAQSQELGQELSQDTISSKRMCWLAVISFSLSIIGVAASGFNFHVYTKYVFSILALLFGLGSKYRLKQKDGQLKGDLLASIGIVNSSVLIAINLAQG